MKRRFSKILGVGLTLALLTSLLLTAAPVSALTKPSVTVDDPTISVETDYSIVTALGVRLGGTSTLTFVDTNDAVRVLAGGDGATITYPTTTGITVGGDVSTSGAELTDGQDTTFTASADDVGDVVITLTAGSVTITSTAGDVDISEAALPTDSIIIEFDEDTDITGVVAGDVTVAATSGIGTPAWGPETVGIGSGDIVDQELTIDVPLAIGVGAMVEVVVSGVKNPDDPGDYTLDVSTSNEDAKTSADYEIEVPDIGVLPGIVQQYNASDILMDQETGNTAINEMVNSAGEDYTIVVGPGEYEITNTIVLDEVGLTLKSSAGAEDTIIVVDTGEDAIQITAADVTVDGFTIQDTADGDTAIKVTGDDVTITDNIFTAEDGYPEGISIEDAAAGATVSGNELDIYHTMMVYGLNGVSDATLSDNTFGAGINIQKTCTGITITDNDIIGSELWGIVFLDQAVVDDILIEGNTISETTEGDAIGICITAGTKVTDLQILDNDITDNEGVGILVDSSVTASADSAIAIKFNTITGNDADNDGYGLQNDSPVAVDAALNWWGTTDADEVADMVNDTDADEGDTTYEPFLAGTAEAVFSASEIAVGAASLDAKDTVGVKVSGATGATVIAVAKYVANPQAAIADAIAFYDVYVVGVTAAEPTATIKFYAGDENSTLYTWSADTEAWVELEDAEYSVYGGYVYVTVDADLLDRTPFVVVAGEAEADELDTPEIAAPVSGDDEVSLTPTFAWSTVADADGYFFELADNANFVLPLVKLDGDVGRLIVTAYAYVGELPYSSAYYWRVKAVSGTVEIGDLLESDWVSAVFITKAEPVEPIPPVTVQEAPVLPDITITQPDIIVQSPDVIVPLPAVVETPITPSWIYVIIGVGAVLVIALLVLIVRTRRVA